MFRYSKNYLNKIFKCILSATEIQIYKKHHIIQGLLRGVSILHIKIKIYLFNIHIMNQTKSYPHSYHCTSSITEEWHW